MTRDYCFNHETPLPLWRDRRVVCCTAAGQVSQHGHIVSVDVDDAIDCQQPWDAANGCRLCGLEKWESLDVAEDDLFARVIDIPVRPAWEGTVDDANSPDPAVRSDWLPRVWVHDPNGTENRNAEFVCWQGSGWQGLVVWYRETDEVEVEASGTLLAAQLQAEASSPLLPTP